MSRDRLVGPIAILVPQSGQWRPAALGRHETHGPELVTTGSPQKPDIRIAKMLPQSSQTLNIRLMSLRDPYVQSSIPLVFYTMCGEHDVDHCARATSHPNLSVAF